MQEAAGRIVYETLQNYGGTCIFGMEDPIHEFHVEDRAATKIVTFHHDRHGAIMAHGYAQATARPGVCAATFGPGASNLSTGRLEALKSSVPLIATVQDHALALRGRNASSEFDHEAALKPFMKAVLRINQPAQAADMARQAFRLATAGRPGPVARAVPDRRRHRSRGRRADHGVQQPDRGRRMQVTRSMN